jgi:hypothetical protein
MLIELSKVKLNRAEAEKIEERLSNWDKLHRDVVADPPSLVELEKMIHVRRVVKALGAR